MASTAKEGLGRRPPARRCRLAAAKVGGIHADIAISELAETLARVVGYRGTLAHDTSNPDGMPRKLLDSSRLMAMGWRPETPLQDGLAETYAWFLEHVCDGTEAA